MGDPLDFAAITALVLTAGLAFGSRIRARLSPHARSVRSFGGGVGLAYVFLSLFPEIDNIHPWLGERVHVITLLSFLGFFALEASLITRARAQAAVPRDTAAEPGETSVFWLHVGIMVFYVAIVMFALPREIAGGLVVAVASGLLIGVHLIYKDYLLRDHAGTEFRVTGRLLLASAPLIGWMAHRLADPSKAVLDIAMAVLAGVLMQSVFRDELPQPGRASLPWLIGGVAVFALLLELT